MKEEDTKLMNIDEGLNSNIIEQHAAIFQAYSMKQYELAYRSTTFLYYTISMYEFNQKENMELLLETLENYFSNLEGRPTNEYEKIQFNSMKFELKQLVNQYIKLTFHSLYELGKWLKIVKVNKDQDYLFSQETFNTELSLLKEKQEDLKTLSTEQLLKLMMPNHINSAHSRLLINKATKLK